MIRLLFATLAGIFLSATCALADEIKTVDGKSATGTLDKITSAEIVLKADGKDLATPLSRVLDVTLRPGNPYPALDKFIEVQLTDDSLLRCKKVTFAAKEAVLELTSGASVKVPMTALYAILHDAKNAEIKKQWDRILKDRKNVDRIALRREDNLNPINGRLGAIDVAKQTIKFKPDSLPEIETAIDKIQGIQFTRTDAPGQASVCKVIDVDGNMLVASKLGYSAGKLEVGTPFGHAVSIDAKVVAKLDFNFGRLTYLSDLVAKMPPSPLLGGFNPVRKDANLDGNPIMLADKKYDKGLSMYAGTELEYNLNGKYVSFKAMLGVDAGIAEEGQGKVMVTIYCDRDKRGEFAVSATKTTPIAINVKDAGTLRIVVSGSNFTGYSGHATLANAHISQ